MRRASSILRKHRAGERVYLPNDSRDNQYILAEIPLTDQLLELIVDNIDENADKPYQNFYQTLAYKVFQTVEEFGLHHVNFVANNKLVRVRYSDQQQVLHTNQQSFFFYCPEHNSTFKTYFDGAVRARKVKILFLATGKDLRLNSGKFHKKVFAATQAIAEKIGLPPETIKLRDHQHLTFDVFAKEKGNKDTITHSFREIAERYKSQGVTIKEPHTSITYAIASIPMARRLLKNTEIDYQSEQPFLNLYKKIEHAFKKACEDNNIDQSAMIANGVSPFVRYDAEESSEVRGELTHIGVNPENAQSRFSVMYDADNLVDNVRFLFFADDSDESHNNYGKFVNQVIGALKSFADQVDWKKADDDIMVRVHQHIMMQV